jgi:hypothetical protein
VNIFASGKMSLTAFRKDLKDNKQAIKETVKLDGLREASSKVFKSGFIDDFFNEDVYGNLARVDGKIVAKKRAIIAPLMSSIVISVTSLLKNHVSADERETVGYKDTLSQASCLGDWKQCFAKHPHSWPKSNIYKYLLDLRHILAGIDESTGKSLSLKMLDRFSGWTATEKILLPTIEDGESLCFRCDLKNIYTYAEAMYGAVGKVILEMSTPSYSWQIEVAINAPKLLKGHSPPQEFSQFMKGFAKQQLVKSYLSKIGVLVYTISYATAMTAGMQAIDGSVARLFVRWLSKNGDQIKEFLGPEAVEEIKELERRQADIFAGGQKFDDLSPEEKAKVLDIAKTGASPPSTSSSSSSSLPPPVVSSKDKKESESPSKKD